MRKLLVLLAMIYAADNFAMDSHMQNTVTKAILAVPVVKKHTKQIERKTIKVVTNYTGLDKEVLTTTGAILITGAQGRISTKALKIKMNFLGARVIPHAEYNWRNGDASSALDFNWSW